MVNNIIRGNLWSSLSEAKNLWCKKHQSEIKHNKSKNHGKQEHLEQNPQHRHHRIHCHCHHLRSDLVHRHIEKASPVTYRLMLLVAGDALWFPNTLWRNQPPYCTDCPTVPHGSMLLSPTRRHIYRKGYSL